MFVTVSTDASDSELIAFSTCPRSSRTSSKISPAERACPGRSVCIGNPSLAGRFLPRQTGVKTRAFEVCGGDRSDLLDGGFADLRQPPRRLDHHRRLVAFPAIRYRSQIRCV